MASFIPPPSHREPSEDEQLTDRIGVRVFLSMVLLMTAVVFVSFLFAFPFKDWFRALGCLAVAAALIVAGHFWLIYIRSEIAGNERTGPEGG